MRQGGGGQGACSGEISDDNDNTDRSGSPKEKRRVGETTTTADMDSVPKAAASMASKRIHGRPIMAPKSRTRSRDASLSSPSAVFDNDRSLSTLSPSARASTTGIS